MRSLIDNHDAFGRAMLADLTGQDRPVDRISEPVAGKSGGPARVLRVEADAGARPHPDTIADRLRRASEILEGLPEEDGFAELLCRPRGIEFRISQRSKHLVRRLSWEAATEARFDVVSAELDLFIEIWRRRHANSIGPDLPRARLVQTQEP